jgi:hypothetical protein
MSNLSSTPRGSHQDQDTMDDRESPHGALHVQLRDAKRQARRNGYRSREQTGVESRVQARSRGGDRWEWWRGTTKIRTRAYVRRS